MPISSRFVINSSIILLTIGFLTLLAIIGATAWLGEKANSYFEDADRLREIRVSAVELRNGLQNADQASVDIS